MTREILFRAKRKDNNDWVYGDLIQLLGEQDKGRKFIIDNRFGACIDNKGNFINTEAPFVNEVIPETICQYTGLTDKNGKKIFEGDIIQYKPEETIYTVMFDSTGYWCLDGNGFRNSEMLIQPDNTNKYIEVIGNKFDEEVN